MQRERRAPRTVGERPPNPCPCSPCMPCISLTGVAASACSHPSRCLGGSVCALGAWRMAPAVPRPDSCRRAAPMHDNTKQQERTARKFSCSRDRRAHRRARASTGQHAVNMHDAWLGWPRMAEDGRGWPKWMAEQCELMVRAGAAACGCPAGRCQAKPQEGLRGHTQGMQGERLADVRAFVERQGISKPCLKGRRWRS